MILILTHKIDLCADLVLPKLEERGQKVLRVNIEDYPLETSLTYELPGEAPPKITVYDKSFDLAGVKAVWYRVPFEYSARRWAQDYQLTRFIESSCNHAWYPLEFFLRGCFWMDRPLAVNTASYKLRQLAVASSLGLQIPRTCVTNDPARARAFFSSVNHKMAGKTMCGGGIHTDESVYVVYTNPIAESDMASIESLRECPCQLQEYVPKKFELRVIVVGNRTFAVEIHSQQSARAKHDWRHYDFENVPHYPHELPGDIRDRCIAFTKTLGLHYGAIDMIVTPDNEYVFLEINPTGQYQWLEALTKLPITDSIVETLISGVSSCKDVDDCMRSDHARGGSTPR